MKKEEVRSQHDYQRKNLGKGWSEEIHSRELDELFSLKKG
jgi:hypothetical protein